MAQSIGHFRSIALAAILSLMALASQAQVDTGMVVVAPADKKDGAGPWSGTLAAGYAKTTGNSESSAANFKGEGRYDRERWHHILGATAIGTS
ncbi:MAG: hypothetical protein OEW88_05735, partial [Gammaproteobacteria bacterium]|nr:hypothetical protein [Gammaproteobacteria bacterium]